MRKIIKRENKGSRVLKKRKESNEMSISPTLMHWLEQQWEKREFNQTQCTKCERIIGK